VAVTITQTPTQGFTWAGSTWDWNDVRVTGRTWETATAYEFAVHEQDAAPGFASASARDIADAFAEAFGTTSVYTDVAVWALNALETLALIETYTDFAEWLNDIQEVFDFSEADATAYSQQFLEQWLSLDADVTGIDRQTAESLGLAEVSPASCSMQPRRSALPRCRRPASVFFGTSMNPCLWARDFRTKSPNLPQVYSRWPSRRSR
jgi:hypothetical protein